MKRKLKKGPAAVLAFSLIALVGTIGFGVAKMLPKGLSLKEKTVHVEAGEAFDPLSLLEEEEADAEVSGTLDTDTPGRYPLLFQSESGTQEALVIVEDTAPPVIEAHDLETGVDTEVDAQSFLDTARDVSRFEVSIENPKALENKAGSRKVVLLARDEYGNEARATVLLTRTDSQQENKEQAAG